MGGLGESGVGHWEQASQGKEHIPCAAYPVAYPVAYPAAYPVGVVGPPFQAYPYLGKVGS